MTMADGSKKCLHGKPPSPRLPLYLDTEHKKGYIKKGMIMRAQLLKNFRMIALPASLSLLFSFSSSLWAGPSSHGIKQHKKPYLVHDESSGVNLPAPVADDSPINPASMKKDSTSNRSKKSAREKDTQKKRTWH